MTIIWVILLIAQSAFGADALVKETVLPNGLKVLTKEVHAAPVVAFNVWYKVGSRNEPFGKTGMSHLLEHMQFKGTKTLKKGDIDRLIQQKGGIINAATWKDWTYYWEALSSDNLELAMKIEADRMVNSVIDAKEFKSEQTVVLSELEGDENDPDRLMYYQMYALAFKEHPYHWPTIGWSNDVRSLTRDDLYKYYKSNYGPSNATMVIVGDFDTNKALALVNKYFGKIPKGPTPPKVTSVEAAQFGKQESVITKAGAADRLLIGYHTPAIGAPDSYALDIIQMVLDSGASSRLYKELVDTQLVTSEYASSTTNRDPDLFLLGATARDGVKLADVQTAMLAEIEKIKSEPITDQELQKSVNQLESSFIYGNDSVTDQAEQLGYFETIKSWRFLDTYLANVRKVTKADIQRVAQKYLTEKNMNVVTFVPEVKQRTSEQLSVNSEQWDGNRYCAYKRDSLQAPSSKFQVPDSKLRTNPKSEIRNPKLVAPTRVVLDNGLVVIVYPNRSNPTVAIQGSLNAGGLLDPEGKSGLAQITAGLLQKGTTKRTADQIAQEKDFVGMSIGASADTESASFSGRSLSKHFDLLLDILADTLRNPNFPQTEFDKLTARRLSGIKQEQDDPDAMAFRAFSGAVFPKGHPLHALTLDEETADTKAVTRDDVLAFYKAHYGPQTAILVIVGDVDPQAAVAGVKQRFGEWQPTGPATRPQISTVPVQTEDVKKVIPMPDKSQVSVLLGYAGQLKRSDPDFYAATIMNYSLGGGGALGSQLGYKIRDEMGLVYNVYTTFDAGLGAGAWYAYLGTNAKNVDKAIKALKDEVAKIRDNGETADQVQRAVDYIAGSFPARRLVDNASIAQTLHGAEFYGLGMDYIRKYQSLYRGVTLAQVNAAAKKYLRPNKYTLVIAGPYTEPAQK